MSGFFSLSGKNHDNNQEQQDQHNQTADTGNNNNYNLFLLNKNEEIYSKGFEVWQQYYQLHHQRNHHQDVDFSIGPSSSGGRRRSIGGGDEPGNYGSYNNNRSAAELGFRVMNHQGRGAVGSDGISCQDCGNQAKKDCEHMRCRTCCKSRGYPCQTHVKSTWVPAARRRERLQQQQQLTTTTTNSSLQTDQQQQLAAVRGGENPKRLREGDGRAGGGAAGGSGGGFEVGHFPAELSSPAVFRCVRVSAMDNAEEHLAYQTAVNIGGHVFKGILYDQGPESRYPGGGGGGGEGPSSAGLIGGGSHQHASQALDLIAGTTSNTNLTMLDPSIYPSSHQLSGFMAGTQFFLPPRP
ncbi:hypothetical protein ABFS83_14G295700 [Erythranthe nasuta]